MAELNRFTIHKDAHEYLTKETDIYSPLAICSQDQFTVEYTGDTDFKKYFRGNFKKVEEFSKYYPAPELFLQNIHWEDIFQNVETALKDILSKTVTIQEESPSLAIINAYPIEMGVMGEILRSLGYSNTVYNFNRNPSINSIAKTFEAYLLLGAWKNSPYFQERSKKVRKNIESLSLKILPDKTFFILDENNTFAPYDHAKIDNYLKTQIGYKEPKNVYRLDKYQDMTFLLQKGIKKVIAFDSDRDLGWAIEAYQSMVQEAKNGVTFIKESYSLESAKSIGYYEDYLIVKNKEYVIYRESIEQKTLSSFPGLREKQKWAETASYTPPEFQKKAQKPQKNSEYGDKSIVPYLILFPIIFIAFIASDLGVFRSKGTTTGSHSNYIFTNWWGGGSSWSSGGGGSSSISSSSKSSSSIIKSFGGGGFSKWGG